MNDRMGNRKHGAVRHLISAALFAIALPISAGAALSAESLSVPPGCEAVVTVEKAGCIATTVLNCGTHFEGRSFANGHLQASHLFTRDWAFSGYVLRNGLQTVEIAFDEGRSITLADLVENGAATTDRRASIGSGRLKALEYHLISEAALTGETVELGGHTFQRGTLRRSFQRSNGANSLEFELEILVSPALDLLIEGMYSRQTKGSDPEILNQTPRSLRFPGDPGFLALKLGEGCNG